MAATVLTITVEEAVAERVIKALCEGAGLPVSGANAKAVVIKMIKQRVITIEKEKKRIATEAEEQALTEPGGIT